MLLALLLLAQSQVLISSGSANPQSGPATLDYLTVGAIDAGVVMAGKDAATSTCAVRIPKPSVRMCMGATDAFWLSHNGGSAVSDIESSAGAFRFLTGGVVANSVVQAGKLALADGTAAAPNLYALADPDTGLYSVGANQLGVSTAGVRSLVFSATPGYIEGAVAASRLKLDGTVGACLDYNSTASVCAATNLVTLATPVANLQSANSVLQFTGVPVLAATTPTISSGFGTSPSVVAGKAYAFRVNVGTGGTATSGVVNLGTTATTGWNCTCADLTTQSSTVFLCKQTASSTTTATIGNFDAAGAAAAWTAADILAVTCTAF